MDGLSPECPAPGVSSPRGSHQWVSLPLLRSELVQVPEFWRWGVPPTLTLPPSHTHVELTLARAQVGLPELSLTPVSSFPSSLASMSFPSCQPRQAALGLVQGSGRLWGGRGWFTGQFLPRNGRGPRVWSPPMALG